MNLFNLSFNHSTKFDYENELLIMERVFFIGLIRILKANQHSRRMCLEVIYINDNHYVL